MFRWFSNSFTHSLAGCQRLAGGLRGGLRGSNKEPVIVEPKPKPSREWYGVEENFVESNKHIGTKRSRSHLMREIQWNHVLRKIKMPEGPPQLSVRSRTVVKI
jgi:hypothetical protein